MGGPLGLGLSFWCSLQADKRGALRGSLQDLHSRRTTGHWGFSQTGSDAKGSDAAESYWRRDYDHGGKEGRGERWGNPTNKVELMIGTREESPNVISRAQILRDDVHHSKFISYCERNKLTVVNIISKDL